MGPKGVEQLQGLEELEELSFEELMELLEDLTRRMADGEVGIEEAAELYERAGAVHRAASERLARVQARLAGLSQGPGAGPGADDD